MEPGVQEGPNHERNCWDDLTPGDYESLVCKEVELTDEAGDSAEV